MKEDMIKKIASSSEYAVQELRAMNMRSKPRIFNMGTPTDTSSHFDDAESKVEEELENRNMEILSSGFERIPQITKKLTEAEMADVEKLIEKMEEDDDVMNVYHTMEE